MSKKLKFQKIYDENYPKVIRLCLGYLSGNEALAQDMTQEVFIKVCLLYTSPSPRDGLLSRMPSSA